MTSKYDKNSALVNQDNQTPRLYPYLNQPEGKQAASKEHKQQKINVKANDYDLSSASHPISCIATFAFKSAAFICYFFVGFIISDIMTFILVTILGALDFWVVKNITGRLLVGLRWWSDFDENGKQLWKFQSYDGQFVPNTVDTAFFWTSQIVGTLVWAVFFVLKMLSLSFFWSLLVFINLSLCGTNLYGYYKCRGQYANKLKNLRKEGIMQIAGRVL